MFEVAKRAHWLQTLVVQVLSGVHPAIEHNVGKTLALKKAFYAAALEALPGDYAEFGVFEGTSLIAAFENDRRLRPKEVPPRTFWGFDSFETRVVLPAEFPVGEASVQNGAQGQVALETATEVLASVP